MRRRGALPAAVQWRTLRGGRAGAPLLQVAMLLPLLLLMWLPWEDLLPCSLPLQEGAWCRLWLRMRCTFCGS